ncbi:inner centromere protein A-like, partial [Pezoporus wallicus]|uniref:inner centromere protein A-like n=1 Tax=Pezoporus wallicus TaxID=35540 RepID=UPI00254FF1F2
SLSRRREVEEQGMRMLESNLGAEPGPMTRTPSQRRRSRKRQSSSLKDYSKEPSRRRLSRRRSSIKLVSFKPGSQRRQSKEQPLDPGCGGEGAQAYAAPELPALPGDGAAEAPGPSRAQAGDPQRWPAGACELPVCEQSPRGDAASEWQDEAPVTGVRAGPAARGAQAAPGRRTSTSTPKAAGAGAAPDLAEPLLPGSGSRGAALGPRARRCSGRRSSLSAPPAGRRCSLAGRRASRSRRAVARKAAAAATLESSSASSRVSCQSSLEACVEEDVAGTRPGLELDPPREGVSSKEQPQDRAAPFAEHSPGQGHCPIPASSSSWAAPRSAGVMAQQGGRARTRSRTQAMGAVWKGQQQQQPGAQAPSPSGERRGSPAEPPPGAGSKVLRSLLRAVQRHPLLPSPAPPGHGGVVRSLLQRSTRTRPSPKGDFVVSNNTLNRGHWRVLWASWALTAPSPLTGIVQLWPRQCTVAKPALFLPYYSLPIPEKERQRLESLRKKQEAEEQRKKKMEEEKRQRQAEMKQKREERLRKALQARERAEEEKKKRMEQKILQSDEKVRLSQARDREEKAEERGRKKLSKKSGEAEARKQKALKGEEDELDQPEPLQKRREDEVRGKGKKVLELRSLLEQQQAEHGKERDHRPGGKEKPPHPQLGAAAFPEKHRKVGAEVVLEQLLCWEHGRHRRVFSAVFLSKASMFSVALFREANTIKLVTSPTCYCRELGLVQEPPALEEEAGLQRPGERKLKQPEAPTAAAGTGLSKTLKKSISAPYLKPLKGTEQSSHPKVSEDNYGMDQNSDDATDDENDPRNPVPAWADGPRLKQGIMHQYYHPVNTDQLFGLISGLRLEEIFGKSKPRYFKRTSSAVWHSPPRPRSASGPSCSLNK